MTIVQTIWCLSEAQQLILLSSDATLENTLKVNQGQFHFQQLPPNGLDKEMEHTEHPCMSWQSLRSHCYRLIAGYTHTDQKGTFGPSKI